MSETSSNPGRLSVVATPIGNLQDITFRAVETLKNADLIVAEDTRHTKKLCSHYGVGTALKSLHAHSDDAKIDKIAERLAQGEHVALVTDAGTPAVSDPGQRLVARAHQLKIAIEVIPGPSAALAALSVSGLPGSRFSFEGFLPRSGGSRREAIDRISTSTCNVVVFESPNRLRKTLEDLGTHLQQDRAIVVCRELTKLHEQTISATVGTMVAQLPEVVRGEVTLVIGPAELTGIDVDETEVHAALQRYKQQGLSAKDAADRLKTLTGWPKRKAYQQTIKHYEATE